MILWTFKPWKETVPPTWDAVRFRSWRRVLAVSDWSIGVHTETSDSQDEEWYGFHDYFYLGFARDFKICFFREWYDGPQRALWLGFFYVSWGA